MEATSANPLQQAFMSPPDYDYIKIDAPAQDTCYCMMNLLTCCMIQACLSPNDHQDQELHGEQGLGFRRRQREQCRDLQDPAFQAQARCSMTLRVSDDDTSSEVQGVDGSRTADNELQQCHGKHVRQQAVCFRARRRAARVVHVVPQKGSDQR